MNHERITALVRELRQSENPVTHQDVVDNTENFSSQAKAVLAYMQEGHTITSLEGLKKFGIISFPRRILDIEKMTGKAPNRRRITVEKSNGKKVSVCEYWIEQEN